MFGGKGKLSSSDKPFFRAAEKLLETALYFHVFILNYELVKLCPFYSRSV